MEELQVRCPKCEWEPDGKPHWQCTCGKQWDTFSTGGRCPACGKLWEQTQCVIPAGGCGGWSPHLDWYKGLEEVIASLKEDVKQLIEEPVKIGFS